MTEYSQEIEIPSRTEGKHNSDIGMKDFYSFYRKNYTHKSPSHDLSSKKYRAIVKDFNSIIADRIVRKPFDFNIPFKLGKICLRKYKKKPKVREDGTYYYSLPVDWKSTLELWKNDEEARKNKKLVRYFNKDTGGYIFKIFYFKLHANYKNRSVYNFRPVRSLKQLVKNLVKKQKIDCYEI